MGKNGNGTWTRWVVGILVTVLIVASTAIATFLVGYGGIEREVTEMKPDVQKNTEHRYRFEEKVTNIDKKVDQMDKKIDLILEEVKK